jgi:hypothetical protein
VSVNEVKVAIFRDTVVKGLQFPVFAFMRLIDNSAPPKAQFPADEFLMIKALFLMRRSKRYSQRGKLELLCQAQTVSFRKLETPPKRTARQQRLLSSSKSAPYD